tara:strand:+ start:3528 stop:4040 length:513 start_codon:yes stop_codon:yes gene_type:complete
MTNIKAKEILKNKFWIIEDANQGNKIGTLSKDENNHYMYYCQRPCEGVGCKTRTEYYSCLKDLKKGIGGEILWSNATISDANKTVSKEIYGLVTSTVPYNAMYDLKRKFALFTKSKKSKSLYCAGYFIIHFEKGWVKSLCPKQVTLEKYEYRGPFKTELEMRQELSRANR